MGCSKVWEFVTRSPEETRALAERLAACLRGGEVIAFTGGMGAGKTAFTRGLAIGLGAGDVASSPTFAIVNEYPGQINLAHFDMYRIEGWEDLESTGFFDYLNGDWVVAVEWSENIEAALPEPHITVDIAMGEGDRRTITVTGDERFL